MAHSIGFDNIGINYAHYSIQTRNWLADTAQANSTIAQDGSSPACNEKERTVLLTLNDGLTNLTW